MASNGNNWSLGKLLAVAAAAGVVVFLFLLWLLQFSGWSALMWGVIIGAVVFLILWLNFAASDQAGQAHGTGSTADAGAEAAAAAERAAAERAAVEAAAAERAASDAAAADAAAAEQAAAEQAAVAETAALEAAADAAAEAAAAEEAAAEKAAAEAAAAEAEAGEGLDKDGAREDAGEGAKPEMLSAAREGGADNLKEIKGVGPKMEQMLNQMGVYHFDQVAGWSADEVAWVDANLKGFKGRVSRDGWVDQARILASGEETEFSKRVDKGEVY